MSPSLTVTRSTLPPRSLVFWAVLRASTCGAKNQPALLGGGDGDRRGGPVSPEASPVICGHVRRGLVATEVDRPCGGAGHRDVVEVGQRLERGLDVGVTSWNGIGAVVWPSKVSVNVPPVAPATVIVWFSFVSWLLNGA